MNEDTTLLEQASSIQAKIIQRQPTHFMRQTNKAIYDTFINAEQDVIQNTLNAPMYAIPAATGSGKTTFTCALIIAKYRNDPNYTAVLVTNTIKEVQSLYNTLSKYLPPEAVYIHTSAHTSHDPISVKHEYGEDVANHLTNLGRSSTIGLSKHRIIICTHALWIKEGKTNEDLGVRLFNGTSQRTHIIIDELPDFTYSQQVVPSDIAYLLEQLGRLTNVDEASSVVETIQKNMLVLCASQTQRFSAANIVTSEQYKVIESIDWQSLPNEPDFDRTENILSFLKNASDERCFISRGHFAGEAVDGARQRTSFVSYQLDLEIDAGTILLDASAQLTAFASLHPNVTLTQTPQVDYSNLAITHIEAPKDFKDIASRSTPRSTDQDYMRWVMNAVHEHTDIGENVLVVVHKRHLAQMHLNDQAIERRGRAIHYCNWGTGIGSNKWRHCTSVFLFSEFHLPRHVYLSETLALQGSSATINNLNSANGQRMTSLTKQVSEGHRLRWLMQLASRGNVRNVDTIGKCGKMKLFTTMDRGLLTESYPRLFPNTPEPTFVIDAQIKRKTKAAKLEAFLLGYDRTEICVSEVATILSLKVKDISRTFKTNACMPLRALGWELSAGNGKASKPIFTKKSIAYIMGVFVWAT